MSAEKFKKFEKWIDYSEVDGLTVGDTFLNFQGPDFWFELETDFCLLCVAKHLRHNDNLLIHRAAAYACMNGVEQAAGAYLSPEDTYELISKHLKVKPELKEILAW